MKLTLTPPQIMFLLFCTLILIILLLLSLDIVLLSKLFSKNKKNKETGLLQDIIKIQAFITTRLQVNQNLKPLESICPTEAINYNSDNHSIQISKNLCLGVLCLRCIDYFNK